jgi:hypothetical protein
MDMIIFTQALEHGQVTFVKGFDGARPFRRVK